jgi:hypothetical protein
MKWIFPCEVEWRSYRIRQKRVNIFLIFSRNIIPKLRVSQAAAPPGKPSGFGCRGALRMSLASRSSGDAAGMPPSSANREANDLRCDEQERHRSMVTMLLLFSRRRRKSRASRIVANFSRSLRRSAIPISRNSRARHIYIVDGAPDRGHPPSRSYGVTSRPASGGLQPITSHPPSLKLRRGRLITNHPGIKD